MKRQLLLLLTALLPLLASAYDAKIGGIYYNFWGDEATVTNNGNNSYSNTVVIPKSVTYNGKTYPVTSIDYQAFSGCSSLTSVTIPNSVTSIWREAFYNCSRLSSITIPNSVTEIGLEAFSGCSGLTSIKVETGNTKYDSRNNCNAIIETATNTLIAGFKNTIIPNSVTSIGLSAFSGCSGLTSITIPNGVICIGAEAFDGCSGLTSVTIGNSVTGIDYGAFRYCSGLTSVTIPNSVTSIGSYAFYYCSNLTSITIPNSVTSIGISAFEGCRKLTSITIPNSVTSIGWGAFYYCSNLTSVTISNSVTSIGGSAFSETRWFNAQPDGILYLDNWLIGYKGTKPTGNVTIKSGTRGIAGSAFYGCSGLTSVTIPESVTSIGESAFYGCSGLTSITIPNSVTSIGGSAFSGCNGLTSFTIPNSVTSLGGGAFSGTGWYDAQPDGILYLDNWLIGYKGTKPTGNVTIKSGTRGIAGSAFSGCSGFTSVTIPNGVTSIGETAFYWCSGLTSITIPNSVTSIGDGAFNGCSRLTSVTIGSGVTSIGDGAFCWCSGLTDVWCYAESVPSIVCNPFSESSISSATLHVPAGLIEHYKAKWPWSKYGNIVAIPKPYTLTYYVDGEVYKTYEVEVGAAITPEPAPTKEGYTFSGWTYIPSTMPAADVVVMGSFTINSYTLTYKVDGEVYKSYDVEYGAAITPEPEPTKEGYTFSGWSEIPETMPAHNVTVTGTFTKIIIKCATPTISYANGKLTFNCETEGAICHSTITDTDIKSYSGNEVDLTVTYYISVYATKEEYEDSEVATGTLCWIDQQPSTEGIVAEDAVTEVKALPILIQSNRGTITVQGANEGTEVSVFSVNGMKQGSAIATNGFATIYTSLHPGSTAIVKIGEKAIKVMVK